MSFYSFGSYTPEIASDVFIAPGSYLIGRVCISEGASIWYNCVLRGDVSNITVGRNTNIQDGSTLHGATKPVQLDVNIGDYVTVGHNAIIHGCNIDNYAFIGMGAIILSGAHIGEGAIIGAGSLVTEGKIVPPNVVAAGVPFKIVRPVTEEEKQWALQVNEAYSQRARLYSQAVKPVLPNCVKPAGRG